MTPITPITCEDFSLCLQKTPTCAVIFTASWCGPCKELKARVQHPLSTMNGVTFYSVDVDADPELAGHYEVTSLPTTVFFSKGWAVTSVVGADYAEVQRICNGG